MSNRQETFCNMSGLCLERGWGDLEMSWICCLWSHFSLSKKTFGCKLESHFRALYYCHVFKESPGTSSPLRDRLLQACFGSEKDLARHPQFCNCRINLNLLLDEDLVHQDLTIPSNSAPGLRTTTLPLLPPLLQPQGESIFLSVPIRDVNSTFIAEMVTWWQIIF